MARNMRTLRIELGENAYLDLLAENRERWNAARLVALLKLRLGLVYGPGRL